jgi:Permease for cytosine/purines, uracil, thiamine, allantoin
LHACLATLATIIAANVVGPANDFAHLWPRRISFRTGGLITGVLGILIQPWKLIADPTGYIFKWLVAYSSLLGAVGGLLIADYYVIRRTRLDANGLYRSGGLYWYSNGFNPVALIALAVGIAPCVPGFLGLVGVLEVSPMWTSRREDQGSEGRPEKTINSVWPLVFPGLPGLPRSDPWSSPANAKLRAPDKTFDKDLDLDLGGGVTARLLWFGGAHTKGDELTFVEPDKTLISGGGVGLEGGGLVWGDDAETCGIVVADRGGRGPLSSFAFAGLADDGTGDGECDEAEQA